MKSIVRNQWYCWTLFFFYKNPNESEFQFHFVRLYFPSTDIPEKSRSYYVILNNSRNTFVAWTWKKDFLSIYIYLDKINTFDYSQSKLMNCTNWTNNQIFPDFKLNKQHLSTSNELIQIDIIVKSQHSWYF